MAVEGIGAVAQTDVANLRNAGLGEEDFLKILITQLSFQDPLKPLDNQEFVAQIAQFSGLELNREANQNVQNLLEFQAATQAVGLIGKEVQVSTATGSETGTVGTVTFQGGTPLLQVKKLDNNFITDVSLSRVTLVRDIPATTTSAGASTTGGTP